MSGDARLTDPLAAGAAAAGLVTATAAWVVAGARTPGFDPVVKSLSQLQRSGADTRPLMTAGLTALGVGLLAAAPVLGRALQRDGRPSRLGRALLALAGAATLTGAAFPLAADRGLPQDLPHMASATVGYVCVCLLPLLGGRRLRGRAATASYVVGAVTSAAMLGTLPLDAVSGALQRLGLTLGTGWAVVVVARYARSSSTERRSAACSDTGVSTPR